MNVSLASANNEIKIVHKIFWKESFLIIENQIESNFNICESACFRLKAVVVLIAPTIKQKYNVLILILFLVSLFEINSFEEHFADHNPN